MGIEPLVPVAPDAAAGSHAGKIARTVRAWPLSSLFGLFALALVAPVLGFGMFAANRMIVAERADGEEQLLRTVRMLAAAIDREVKDLIEELQAFAASGELKEGDLAGFHRNASGILRGTGKGILLVDRDYNQIVDTRLPYGTSLPQFADAETASEVFATGMPASGDLLIGHVAQQPIVVVIVPVTVEGAVRYLLVISLEPAALSRTLEQQYLPHGWLAGVSDGNDRMLARSERHQEFFGKPLSSAIKAKSIGRLGVTATEDEHGNRILLAHLWSDVSGWRTAVWVPLAILEAPARRLWSVLAGLTVAAFALSLLAAALVGRWLARPIARVAGAAAALGLGDPVAYIPCAIAEVNVVGRALAAAAENRRRADAHVLFLMRELSHRTKNVMAVVQAISSQTARKSIDVEDFEQRFTQRLNALARSQDLLVERNWKGVAIGDLVRTQLEPFLDSAQERLAVNGPSLALIPNAAQDLGLALHELATNASKYGALSVPAGKIEICWSIENGTAGEQRFRMTWRETGGPVVKPPIHKGFGSTVITRSLSITFNGKAEVEYRPEGLSWQLAAPVGDFIAELS